MLLLLNDKFIPRRHPFKLDELIVGPIRGEQRARVLEVLELGLALEFELRNYSLRRRGLLRYMYNNRFISILIRSASVEEGAEFLKARPPIGCLSFLMLGFLNARL